MSAGLVTFLCARYDAEQAIAEAAIEDDCGQDGGFEDASWLTTGKAGCRFGEAAAALIRARAVPRRMLAEVDAKRRIIDLIALNGDGQPLYRDSGAQVWEDALKLLALPYADYPDYRTEWRP